MKNFTGTSQPQDEAKMIKKNKNQERFIDGKLTLTAQLKSQLMVIAFRRAVIGILLYLQCSFFSAVSWH